jgi:putative endonuclease
MEHIQKGIAGERRACNYLVNEGYTILVQNFRAGKGEIDIIASKDNCICFIEVKYRKNNRFGYPEIFVTDKKLRKIQETADVYVHLFGWHGRIRFDVIAITGEEAPVHMLDVTL